MVERQRIAMPPIVAEWVTRLRMKVHGRFGVRVNRDALTKLAGLLVLAGDEDERAWAVFEPLVFSHVARVAQLDRLVHSIPPIPDRILHVVKCLEAFERISPVPMGKGGAKLSTIVEVILQLPDPPEVYVRSVVGGGLQYLGAVFHPNTLDHHKKHLRGYFSGMYGESGYWAQQEVKVYR